MRTRRAEESPGAAIDSGLLVDVVAMAAVEEDRSAEVVRGSRLRGLLPIFRRRRTALAGRKLGVLRDLPPAKGDAIRYPCGKIRYVLLNHSISIANEKTEVQEKFKNETHFKSEPALNF